MTLDMTEKEIKEAEEKGVKIKKLEATCGKIKIKDIKKNG
jgi:hypothetical protein